MIDRTIVVRAPQHNTHRLLTRVDDHIRGVTPSNCTGNSITARMPGASGSGRGEKWDGPRETFQVNVSSQLIHGLAHAGMGVERDEDLGDECSGGANSLYKDKENPLDKITTWYCSNEKVSE